MNICLEYEVINGVIQPFDEDSHYGEDILNDEESLKLVKDHIVITEKTNECGLIQFDGKKIIIEKHLKIKES